MKLLKKELRLCMHPTAYLMPFLSVLLLVPNYPYSVSFYYVTLSIFFICLTARENHDAAYTLSLPVSRGDMVRGRILVTCCVEMVQMLLCALFIFLKSRIGYQPNSAGLDAGIAVLGEGFLVYGLFHIVFFPLLYKDINQVGKAFAIASVVVFVYIAFSVAATYVIPFFRDALDTPDPEHLTEKLIFLGAGAVFFLAATLTALRVSIKRFERVDLQL